MSKIISCSICLEDIPEESKQVAKSGKTYINFVVDEKREVDQYGKTHSVYIQQTKEQREAKEKKTYIGNGKEFEFSTKAMDDNAPISGKQSVGDPQPGDLPF